VELLVTIDQRFLQLVNFGLLGVVESLVEQATVGVEGVLFCEAITLMALTVCRRPAVVLALPVVEVRAPPSGTSTGVALPVGPSVVAALVLVIPFGCHEVFLESRAGRRDECKMNSLVKLVVVRSFV